MVSDSIIDQSSHFESENDDDELSDILDKIEALALKWQRENQNCTPGKVKKFVHACRDKSEAEVIELFQLLEDQGRGHREISGKVVKFCPNAEIPQI